MNDAAGLPDGGREIAVSTVRAVGRILSLWRPRAGRLAAGGFLAALSALAGVLLLGLAGGTVASGPRPVAGIVGVAAGAMILRLLGAGRIGLRYAERLATHDAMFRALADLRVWFFRRIAGNAGSGLGFRRSADLLSRLVGDIETLDSLYLRILVPTLAALAVLPILVVVLARRDPALAATVGLLFVGCAVVIPLVAARMAWRSGAATGEAASALRVAVLDAVSGLREVRAFGAEGRVLANVQAREGTLIAAQLGAARRAALVDALGGFAREAAMIAVLASVATGLAAGVGGASSAVIAVFVVLAGFELAGGLPRAGVLAGAAAAAARRVVGAADASPAPGAPRGDETTPATALRPRPADLTLRFEAIRFGWEAGRPVLTDLTLTVAPGSRVAILGPSGAGKSTLASLALGLARPEAGRVTLGGIDVGGLDPATLRGTIALLNQSTHLFGDTIRANLLIGRADADDASLWRALDEASLGDWVRTLPDGLDTWLGEGGATVSGGQGRRIALARVLLSEAPILILDEPAAGLDADAERAFLLSLERGGAGRTVILIAHRLTGVERLDRIWRLSGGMAAAAAA